MMTIFDKNNNVVGWYDHQGRYIYDCYMNWLGFVKDVNVFTTNRKWIGGLKYGNFTDKNGRPVAWIEGNLPRGVSPLLPPNPPFQPIRPNRPLRPVAPIRPLMGLMPVGGWSIYSWKEYWKQ